MSHIAHLLISFLAQRSRSAWIWHMKPSLKRKCEVILLVLPEIWVKGSASYLSTWLSNTAVFIGNAQYGTRNKINCRTLENRLAGDNRMCRGRNSEWATTMPMLSFCSQREHIRCFVCNLSSIFITLYSWVPLSSYFFPSRKKTNPTPQH